MTDKTVTRMDLSEAVFREVGLGLVSEERPAEDRRSKPRLLPTGELWLLPGRLTDNRGFTLSGLNNAFAKLVRAGVKILLLNLPGDLGTSAGTDLDGDFGIDGKKLALLCHEAERLVVAAVALSPSFRSPLNSLLLLLLSLLLSLSLPLSLSLSSGPRICLNCNDPLRLVDAILSMVFSPNAFELSGLISVI